MTAKNLERNAAEGIHRIEDAHTNWYLVEDGGRVTIVDTGLPRSWASFHDAMRAINRRPFEIDAVVLTHGHFDHMGIARHLQQDFDLPVMAHSAELPVVAHPWNYDHEHSRLPYLRHPGFLRAFSAMTWMGAPFVKGTKKVVAYEAGQTLDVPGRPQVIPTPGHTHGHCSLYFPDRGAVIVGDAFVTLDPYTGRTGPRIVAGAATADSATALASLDALAALSAETALTGHGPAWRGSMAAAVDQARAAGPA